MRKTYILDTNVLLTEPKSIYSFKDNEVILPFTIIEELDKIKSRPNQVGAHAREMARVLTELIEDHPETNLRNGITLESGGKLRVLSISDFDEHVRLPNELDPSNKDNHILGVCYAMLLQAKKAKKEAPILVTKDILLRVKCNTIGIPCEDYKGLDVAETVDSIYRGYTVLDVDDDVLQSYYESVNDTLLAADLNPIFEGNGIRKPSQNEFVILRNPAHPEHENSPFVRWVGDGYLAKMPAPISEKNGIYGLRPRNLEQRMALDLLMDSNVDMVTLIGSAGTGKSLLAIAAGLQQVIEKKQYKRLVVIKPTVAVGSEQGFLPGPQPLDAKILTPTGWSTMGKMTPGTEIISRDGKKTTVLEVYPKGTKEVFSIHTDEGVSTEACIDHLWDVNIYNKRKNTNTKRILHTGEIQNLINDKNLIVRIPRAEAVEFNSTKKELDPYLLGALLGDGSFKDSHVTLYSGQEDSEEMYKKILPMAKNIGCRLVQKTNINNVSSFRFYSENKKLGQKSTKAILTNASTGQAFSFESLQAASKFLGFKSPKSIRKHFKESKELKGYKIELQTPVSRHINPIRIILYNLNLASKSCYDKFIPKEYIYSASIEDRLKLLRGLMDTDGSCKKNGEAAFYTTSLNLAQDIKELVASLGGRAVIRERTRKTGTINGFKVKSNRKTYEFNISMPEKMCPFSLPRKANNWKPVVSRNPKINSITSTGNKKEVQCIKVANPEHLYITDGFIVTHNTKEEKLMPWLAPIMDNLRQLMFSGKKSKYNESMITDLMDDGTIELEAITYLRGRSISDAYIIIDESQNCGSHELKTILTRVGENSKIVLTGDIEQIDNVYLDAVSNGLAIAVEKFKESDITGHCTMVKGERSKLATLAAKVL
jgi:predicted ribonuclease YlaK